MDARSFLAAAALVVGCGGSAPSTPWRAAVSLDAEAWGQPCGRQAADEESPRHKGDPNLQRLRWARGLESPGPAYPLCELLRDRRTDQLLVLDVQVVWRVHGDVSVASALPTIERVRAMILDELAPRYRATAMFVSASERGPRAIHLAGDFLIEGGFGRSLAPAGGTSPIDVWSLRVFRSGE